MPAWTLLSIPATFVLLALVLYLSDVAETRIVSPKALILRAVSARRTSPELTERLVVAEVERLIRAGSVIENTTQTTNRTHTTQTSQTTGGKASSAPNQSQ